MQWEYSFTYMQTQANFWAPKDPTGQIKNRFWTPYSLLLEKSHKIA